MCIHAAIILDRGECRLSSAADIPASTAKELLKAPVWGLAGKPRVFKPAESPAWYRQIDIQDENLDVLKSQTPLWGLQGDGSQIKRLKDQESCDL